MSNCTNCLYGKFEQQDSLYKDVYKYCPGTIAPVRCKCLKTGITLRTVEIFNKCLSWEPMHRKAGAAE